MFKKRQLQTNEDPFVKPIIRQTNIIQSNVEKKWSLIDRTTLELEQRRIKEQQAREQQAREHQAREQQVREQQARVQQVREQQVREQQVREQQAKEQQVREQQVREQQVREQQARVQQARVQQVREQQARQQQARQQQARQQQAKEQQVREQQVREQQVREQQAREQQSREQQSKEQQAKEQQLIVQQSREQQAKEQQLIVQQSREQQSIEQQAKEQQAREQQVREQQVKEQQVREQQAREQQVKEQQAREQQVKEQQVKEQQAREQQAREQQAREQQAREQQVKEQQAREQQAREQQVKEQQAREQQAREKQAREQQTREQQTREQQNLINFNHTLNNRRKPTVSLQTSMPVELHGINETPFLIEKMSITKEHTNEPTLKEPTIDKNQQIKIIDIFASKFVENIANGLAKILKECGLEVHVNIRNLENQDIKKCKEEEGRFLFIFCPQTLLQSKSDAVYPSNLMKLPENKYFLYQLEQFDVGSEKNMNNHILNLVKNSRHTFDYSENNLAYYPREVEGKVSYLLPPVVEMTTDILEKKYDILFCGYMNEMRETTLNELRKAGYNILHVTNVFGPSLTKLIKESRIFLNIHHNNSKCLETCRLNEAVMSPDTYIISEKCSSDKDKIEEIYSERVHFIEKKDILKKVKELMDCGKTEYKEDNIKKLLSKIYTNAYIKIKLLNYNINHETINDVNNVYLNNTFDSRVERDGSIIRKNNSFNDTVILYRKNSLPFYIDSTETFYKLYVDFDLSYYKNKYYNQTTLSDIKIMYDFHTIDEYKRRLYNDKIKIVIYTPSLYDKCGGINALHRLTELINNLKHKFVYAKLYCYDGSKYVNKYCNDFANPFEINDNTIVIYPEIVKGNPLNAKYVLRWILLDLGIEMDKTHYLNWNQTDIVYHWEPNTTNNKIKQLSIPFLEKEFKNYNSKKRTKTCFIVKKGPLIHGSSKIKYMHPTDSINIDNMSLIDIVKVFNESHTFYCYDPNTFYILSATVCGCISVIYPIENMSADSFYKNRITCIDDFTFNSGIAYGNSNDQLLHARNTLKDAPDNLNTLLSKYELTVSKFVEDIYELFTVGKNLPTIRDIYYINS
jgi:hypothetical protein